MLPKLKFWIGVIFAMALVISISEADAKDKQYTFKLAHLTSATSPHGVTAEKFAKAVEAETNGGIKINVVHSGALGSGPENLEQISLGTIEMALLWHNFMGSYSKKYLADDLPFAWSARWQAYAAYYGELGEALRKHTQTLGIQNLAFWEQGYRCITNNKRPIVKPEDLKGLKLRIPEVKIRIEMFKALGANPVPMAFGELYTGLQLGVVDGQENPLPVIYSSKFYEIQKYLSLSRHNWTTAFLAINKKIWDGLSPEYREILQRNARKYAEYNNSLVRKGELEAIEKLKEKGMEVNEIDIEAFKATVEPVYQRTASELGKEIQGLVKFYTAQD